MASPTDEPSTQSGRDYGLWAFLGGVGLIVAIALVFAGYLARDKIGALILNVDRMLSETGHPMEKRIRFPDTPPGFTLTGTASGPPGFLLVSGYFVDVGRPEIRLVDLADGTVRHVWAPAHADIAAASEFDDLRPARRFEPQAPMLMEDGGLVFLVNAGPLVRIGACSELEWVVDGEFHHSLERTLDGNLVVPVNMRPKWQHPDFPVNFRDDGMAIVTPDGEMIEKRSTIEMMHSAGLLGLMHTNYGGEPDFAHINDIEVARETTRSWRRGDMVMSFRHLNLVFLWRPETEEIVWWQSGPWLKQHDPDMHPDGSITIFSNDVVLEWTDEMDRMLNVPMTGHSRVIRVTPATGEVKEVFTEALRDNAIFTPTQGLHRMLEGGDVFIEETDFGRLTRVSADGIVWSYYNRNAEVAGVLNWSRFLTAEEVAAAKLSAEC